MADPGTDALDWATVDASSCSIAWTAEVLGDRWSLLVLREVALGVDRFDAIQAHLSISRRTLAERLESLTSRGVLERVPYTVPGQRARHSYRLTRAGEEARVLLQAMGDWGARHRPDDVGPPVTVLRCDCGAPARVDATCTEGGHRRSGTGS